MTALIQYGGLQLFAGLPLFGGMQQPNVLNPILVSQRDDLAVLRECTTELQAWRARAESRLSPTHAEELRAIRAAKGSNASRPAPQHPTEKSR